MFWSALCAVPMVEGAVIQHVLKPPFQASTDYHPQVTPCEALVNDELENALICSDCTISPQTIHACGERIPSEAKGLLSETCSSTSPAQCLHPSSSHLSLCVVSPESGRNLSMPCAFRLLHVQTNSQCLHKLKQVDISGNVLGESHF